MATRRLGNAHQEIEEYRSRLFLKRWDFASSGVQDRLRNLGNLIGTAHGDELHRHVVVSSIAALQTFHRATIVSIVDAGDLYKVRAAESISEKISMKDALSWFSGNEVTFGELVSHSAPCNSVIDLMSRLETLLDCEMKKALTDAISPWDRRNRTEPAARIIPDVDRLLADLSEAFRLRHIFAHEAAPLVTVNADDCRRLHAAIAQWVEAVEAVLWATVYQHQPLTQYEINMYSRAELLEARKKLAKAMRKALSNARTAGSAAWLRQNHFAWMRAIMDWEHGTYGSLKGSMWPAVFGVDLAKAIQARVEQVIAWNASRNPEEPAE
jgi:hypothetical protein